VLWLCLILAGALAGVLAGLFGVGGGIVLVPVLMQLLPLAGVESESVNHAAVATSLASIVFTGSSSALRHHWLKNVDWSMVVAMVPGLVIGAVLGTFVASAISAEGLKRLIAFLMAIVAIRLMLKLDVKHQLWALPGKKLLLFVSGVIGALSSICGIGGGSLTVPFLNASGVQMLRAVAVSAACGVPIALLGSISYMFLVPDSSMLVGPYAIGMVVWPAVLSIALGSIIFAQLGAKWAHQLPVALLRRLFGLLLALVALRLLMQ